MIVAIVFVLAATLVSSSAGADDAWTLFEFQAYNREYVDMRPGAEWRREGPVDAVVSSPTHRLVIRDHSLELRPLRGDVHQARVRVNFSGEGELQARLADAGESLIEDHVTAPQQEIEVDARLRFTPVEGGWELETLELPESIEVAIESRIADQMIGMCSSALAFLGVRCDGLEEMFATATVPLPQAGGVYYLPAERLTAGERARFDRYLSQASGESQAQE